MKLGNLKTKNNVWEFARYLFVAGLSFVVDLVVFTVVEELLISSIGERAIIVSTIIARVISSVVNYFLNSRFVFKQYDHWSILKYYLLVVIQMCVSAGSVFLISKSVNINDTVVKIVVDTIIFVSNYVIQKLIVFKTVVKE